MANPPQSRFYDIALPCLTEYSGTGGPARLSLVRPSLTSAVEPSKTRLLLVSRQHHPNTHLHMYVHICRCYDSLISSAANYPCADHLSPISSISWCPPPTRTSACTTQSRHELPRIPCKAYACLEARPPLHHWRSCHLLPRQHGTEHHDSR